MSLRASDLDVLGDLAGAVGLVDGGGSFREDWLSKPGDYFSSVLADEHQRQSLVAFVDNVLGGGTQSKAPDGTTWLPIVERSAPDFHLYVVLDDRPAASVAIGLGIRMSAANPAASVTAHVPLFRAAKHGQTVASPLVIGTADAVVTVAADVTVDSTAPVPGGAHLGGLRLRVAVPTAAGAPPTLSLSLQQLQMPGAPSPRDLTIDASNAGDLESSIVDLVLGLVRAQAAALPPGPLTALAGLLGLRDGVGVPALPFQDFATRGVAALAAWLEQVLRTPASRAAWVGQLASLLGGAVSVDQVAFTIGPAHLTVGVGVVTGSDGHTRLTPTIAIQMSTGADAVVRASADLCTIDLGTGAASALPALALQLVLGRRPDGGAVLLDQAGPPAVRVETVRAGFALDAARRPTFVLAADQVTIGSHTHPTLDLSTPDAVADVGGVVLGDIADEVLGQLGAAADAVRILLGLAAPPGHAEVPALNLSAFLQDPLGAVAGYWQTVVHDHPAAIPTIVTTLRDLIADAAEAGQAVAGSGTAADPWRVGLAGPVDLLAWIDGDRLSLAPALTLVVDTLGQRCTRVESNLRVTIVEIDLAARHVTFLPGIVAGFNVRARGRPQAAFVASTFTLTADSVGVQLAWAPAAGMTARFSAPNLAVDLGSGPLPVPIPSIDAAGHVTLTAADWDKVEQLLGGFATAAGPSWLVELVGTLGWVRRQRSRGAPARLRLADLVVDPRAALVAWLGAIAVRDQDLLLRGLSMLANLIGGTSAGVAGIVEGSGRPTDPWRVPLGRAAGSPRLAVWIGPNGPLASVSIAPTRLQAWRPGLPGFGSSALASALQYEALVAADVAALLAGRPDIVAGLDALAVRWTGTDGRVLPPDTDPPGITVHRVADATWMDLVGAADVESLLDRAPDTIVRVAVAAPNALPWPDVSPDRVVDLTTAGVAPDGFTAPAAATGEWWIALGGRAACRLASGDADGIDGQAARLQRILQGLGSVPGGLVVVSDAESGHAVRRAADAVAAVTDVVLLGTPLGPVSFAALDENPAADTLRLLARLLPAATDELDDDPDLGIGRGLVTALTSLLPLDDPARELQPPSPPAPAPRAGLNVHAVFGVTSEDAVRRALTAIVAAGLAGRSQQRADQPFVDPSELHLAIRVPFPTGTPAIGDAVIDGHAQFELAALTIDGAGVHLSAARDLSLHCGIGRWNGWLVGGPDPGRAPGVIPDKELRRVSIDIDVPIGATGGAAATITLHEPRAFGLDRERWIVQPAGATPPVGVDAATPALPEVRILLSGMADALAGLAAGPAAALADVLRAIHVLAPAGGSVPDAVDHLLHDPAAHLSAVLADATDRQALVAALRGLFGGSGGAPDVVHVTAGPATLDVNLASRQIALTASAAPGAFGLVSWSASVTLDGVARAVSGELTIGDAGATVAGGVQLKIATPFAIALRWFRPGLANPEEVAIWPSPDAAALARALARLLPAELLRVALESLRELDEDTRPILDAGLAAVGLLGGASPDGTRRVLLPVALIADPAAWLEHNSVLGGSTGLAPARVIAVIDALKPILGVGGGPGEWAITNGVTVRADTDAGGAARLALVLDTSAFAPIPAAPGRLTVGGSFGLAFPASAPARPAVDVFVGIAGAATPGRQAAHVTFDRDLQIFLRPAGGADIPLYPNAAGLGQLAQSAVTQALPFILDQLAGLAGHAGVSGEVGTLVAALGDALGVRTGGHFSGPALQAWAANPSAALVARLPAWSTTVLGEIANAVRPLLPGGVGADVTGSSLQLHVGVVTALVTPAPFTVTVTGEAGGVPGVAHVRFGVGLSAAGLDALDVEAGPAAIDAGGVVIRPFFGIHAGTAPAGGRRAELSLGLGDGRRVGARWLLGDRLDLVVINGAVEDTTPADVALALLDTVLDVVASFVMSTAAFTTLLNKTVGASTVRNVLRGVVLADGDPTKLDDGIFDPSKLLARLQHLAVNLAQAAPSVNIDGLIVGLAADDLGAGVKAAGVRVSLAKPVPLVNNGIAITLETDARWIHPPGGPPPPDGIVVDVLKVGPDAGAIAFAAGVSVNGVGLRFGKNAGPLLDIAGVSLGSIALHLFGRVGDLPPAGGVELQLSDLAVGVGGASGGNPVAQGIVGDSGQGSNALAPKFSPALAVQKLGGGPVLVSLRAGDGSGPWWLAIQKGFGPLYIEQVGFGVTVQQDQLQRISILLDGRVALLGLTASVDDLQLTFVVASNASVFDPSRWAVDLAGLAISSDLGGITLEGGLRKFGDGDTVQYVGMLMGRFAVYGLSVFGGYGHGVDHGQRYASFFAFGAVNGPIGGPPAFFVTGIGGGLGINRQIVVPTDLSHFDQFPFIKALDPSATPSPDPMAELTALATYFPQALGSFWFAAGISFTSFALVDGVVVVSVQVGDGLQIALFGLARMALPRPQFPLVSIELGLIARFSSKEGVLWVQAQLTDNSWLLYPDVRLTGGFAYVMWFLGPNAGQFVLTIGGYHPRFHRDGYPDVPRLGLQWRVGPSITIKGESYFALTSEAIMAGARIEVAAEFGPAWAHLTLGADGIVYYDPFHFEVEVYASISAGVTIDVWIGTITISISIGARILVEGPKFHGIATFSVGPIDLSVEFGDPQQPAHPPLPWADFVRKYLEEAAPGVARVLTAVPGKGALPPGAGPGGATDTGTADGSAAKPFTVFAEFEIMVTSTMPTPQINLGARALAVTPSTALGLAPMNIANAGTLVSLTLAGADGDRSAGLTSAVHHAPSFPIGVWGLPQAGDDRKVPSGDVIDAIDGVLLSAVATILPGLPPIDYRHRVETGVRLPLPFVHESSARPTLMTAAGAVAALLPPGPTADQVFAESGVWMARAGNGRTALAAMRNERSGPPRFGTLTDGLAANTAAPPKVALPIAAAPPAVDTRVHPPVPIAVITTPIFQAERPAIRTTATRAAGQPIVTKPPTLESVAAKADLAVPGQLHLVNGVSGAVQSGTIVATGPPPLTRAARGGVAAVSGRGAVGDGADRLGSLLPTAASGLTAAPPAGARAAAATAPASPLLAGEIAVLRFPNAARDLDAAAARPRLNVAGGAARVVALGHGGAVLADAIVSDTASRVPGFAPPVGTERVAVAVSGDANANAAGLSGWHAGTALAYVGWETALGAGSVVRAEGATVSRTRHRRTAGWVRGAELVGGTSLVITRFVDPISVVVVALDDPSGTELGRNLSLGLDGATRPLQADGSVAPPRTVVRGNRTFLVYDLIPHARDPVTVTVASESGWHLAGVMGGVLSADLVVTWLAGRGIDAVVRAVLPGTGGSRTLSWTDVQTPAPVTGPASPRAARPPAAASSKDRRKPARARAAKKTSQRPGKGNRRRAAPPARPGARRKGRK